MTNDFEHLSYAYLHFVPSLVKLLLKYVAHFFKNRYFVVSLLRFESSLYEFWIRILYQLWDLQIFFLMGFGVVAVLCFLKKNFCLTIFWRAEVLHFDIIHSFLSWIIPFGVEIFETFAIQCHKDVTTSSKRRQLRIKSQATNPAPSGEFSPSGAHPRGNPHFVQRDNMLKISKQPSISKLDQC